MPEDGTSTTATETKTEPTSGNGSGSGTKVVTKTVESESDEKFTKEYVHDLREENGKHRIEKKELRDKLKALEDEKAAAETKKLEEEKEFKKLAEAAEKRAAKVEKEAQESVETQRRKTIKTAARAELIKEGILDTDDVLLLDLSKVTWDTDSDEPSGITELVADFKKAKPAKFKAADDTTTTQRARTSTPTTSTATKTKGVDMRDPSVTREEVTRAWEGKFNRA